MKETISFVFCVLLLINQCQSVAVGIERSVSKRCKAPKERVPTLSLVAKIAFKGTLKLD